MAEAITEFYYWCGGGETAVGGQSVSVQHPDQAERERDGVAVGGCAGEALKHGN